jgi:hypothetical protein
LHDLQYLAVTALSRTKKKKKKKKKPKPRRAKPDYYQIGVAPKGVTADGRCVRGVAGGPP